MSVSTEKPKRPPARLYQAMSGVTNRAIAEHAGVSDVFISHVMTGRAKPSPKVRRAISDMLGVPESVLFPDSGAA